MAANVRFTEKQLAQASAMRELGKTNASIAEYLKTTPKTSRDHLDEYELYGFEGYESRRNAPSAEVSKIAQHERTIRLLHLRISILDELIQFGDINVCKKFVSECGEAGCVNDNGWMQVTPKERLNLEAIDVLEIVKHMRKLIVTSANSVHRFSAVSFGL